VQEINKKKNEYPHGNSAKSDSIRFFYSGKVTYLGDYELPSQNILKCPEVPDFLNPSREGIEEF
jgi:hypothetical protein